MRRREETPEHQEVFDGIVMDSDDLQGVIIGESTAVMMSPFDDAPTENLHQKVQELVAAGQLDEMLLQKMNAAMRSVLLDSWHARCATEDSDDMLRMRQGSRRTERARFQ